MMDQASGLRELVAQNSVSNSKFITISSGKGGVGKTNFALNFAYTMANDYNRKVLLIDADIGMANVHLFLKLEPTKNIKNVFNGERIEDVLYHVEGFDVLLGFSGIEDFFEMDDLSIQTLINQLDIVSSQYDYIIIDTGAGIDNNVASFLRASNKAYVITVPEPTALMDAYALMKSLYSLYEYENFHIVVNMVHDIKEGITTFDKLQVNVKKFLNIDIDLLGILPYSDNLKSAVKNKELIVKAFPNDRYCRYIQKICEKELSIEDKFEIEETKENFWQKLFQFMKKGSGS